MAGTEQGEVLNTVVSAKGYWFEVMDLQKLCLPTPLALVVDMATLARKSQHHSVFGGGGERSPTIASPRVVF